MIADLGTLTLTELCDKAADKFKKRVAFEVYRDDYTYNRFTYAEFFRMSVQFAALLSSLGVRRGDRVMILSENSPEWVIAYFGIAHTAAVSVPVLSDFSEVQIANIGVHTEVSAVCVSTKLFPKTSMLIKKMEEITSTSVPLIHLDSIAAEDGEGNGEQIRVTLYGVTKTLPLVQTAARASVEDVSENDLASIIYTSGTLSTSKAVMLSHKNIVWTAHASRSLMKVYPRDRLISVIPLAHTYECVLGLLAAVMSGASIVYLDRPPSPSALLPAIQALRPTIMIAVPLFIEKIYRSQIAPRLQKSLLSRCPLTRSMAIKIAGRRLLGIFGGALRFFGVGGAPLSEDVEIFLRKAQFPYSPGYGLTETSPLVSGTAPYRFPMRSAGSVLTGVEVRIAGTGADVIGEIHVRGPNVMLGYYKDEAKTREAFTEDGWFKTGDLGFLDKKNHLFVRGRLKALILGPSGENIYPEEIESLLYTSDLVEDALVCSGSRGEIVALVRLNEKAQTAIAALSDNIEELKNAVNKRLASFSRINRIEIRREPFEKTPTAKIKRFLYP
ncbi:MAG: AMP-binding protein [Treponema sp.]|jgi:long-chain acyl-CoA synthetase|nr:AMP-binding protein [Treponema sp.]